MHIYYENYIFQQPSWHDSTNSKLEELHDAVLLIAYPSSSSSLSKRHVAQATTLGVQSVKNNQNSLLSIADFCQNSSLSIADLCQKVHLSTADFYQNSPLSTANITKIRPFRQLTLPNSPLSTADLCQKLYLSTADSYQNSPFSTADFTNIRPFQQLTFTKTRPVLNTKH